MLDRARRVALQTVIDPMDRRGMKQERIPASPTHKSG